MSGFLAMSGILDMSAIDRSPDIKRSGGIDMSSLPLPPVPGVIARSLPPPGVGPPEPSSQNPCTQVNPVGQAGDVASHTKLRFCTLGLKHPPAASATTTSAAH